MEKLKKMEKLVALATAIAVLSVGLVPLVISETLNTNPPPVPLPPGDPIDDPEEGNIPPVRGGAKGARVYEADVFQIGGPEIEFLEEEFVPDEILVKFRSEITKAGIDKMIYRYGSTVREISPYTGVWRIEIPSGRTVEEMVELYGTQVGVEYAEPNYYAYASFVPNDTHYPKQWHLDNNEYGGIHMEAAWDISTGSGVTVAIIDTGVAYEDYGKYGRAPDLAGTSFVAGYDFINNDAHPNDDHGHGTHVAGTVAQTTNNSMGVAGVAYNACLMPVKVLNSKGYGNDQQVANGIIWATDHGAQILSMSLGGSSPATVLEQACAYAYNNGATIIASAGNGGSTSPHYPSAYDDYVIAVGATRYDETKTWYSSYGSSLDVMAPGGDTSVDQNGDGYGDGVLQQTFSGSPTNWVYAYYQGTSMATPHVSGTAALLISEGIATTPDDLRAALQETAEDLGSPGWDSTYGWGLIDAHAALQWSG